MQWGQHVGEERRMNGSSLIDDREQIWWETSIHRFKTLRKCQPGQIKLSGTLQCLLETRTEHQILNSQGRACMMHSKHWVLSKRGSQQKLWKVIFKVLKQHMPVNPHNYQPRISYPAKIGFSSEDQAPLLIFPTVKYSFVMKLLKAKASLMTSGHRCHWLAVVIGVID